MILLTTDEIIKLHEKMIERTGGSSGMRDFGLLESAVFSAENCHSPLGNSPFISGFSCGHKFHNNTSEITVVLYSKPRTIAIPFRKTTAIF